jgi:hypothetical protein
MGKLIEAADRVVDHVGDHDFGKASEREAVHAATETLLNCTDGSFDFTDVTVGGDDVHGDGTNIVTDAVKFIVGVDVTHSETAGTVDVDDRLDYGEDGLVSAVCDVGDGPETNSAGNSVKETDALHEEKSIA